jgi:hypothetical protein
VINIPIHRCSKDGKSGYQWGDHGTCYTYTSGDEASRKKAREKAEAQAAAAHASGYKGSCESIIELIRNLREDVKSFRLASKPKKKYYSTSKPYYRFFLEEIHEELKGSGWDDEDLLIDVKADGLRLTSGVIDGEGFFYVDPEDLKEKSPDVTNRLPHLKKEIEKVLPDNTIVDSEFIAMTKDRDEILHRTVSNSLLNSNIKGKELEEFATIYVFDVLYWKGQDIRQQPLKERLEILQQLDGTDNILIERISTSTDKKADAYRVKGNEKSKINSAVEKITQDKIGRPKHIAEGVMFKKMGHQYERPQNHGWGKAKTLYELDVRVLNKDQVKGSPGVYNYTLGIDIDKEYFNKLVSMSTKNWYHEVGVISEGKFYRGKDAKEHKGQYVMILGKSDNHKEKDEIEVGDIIRVATEEVLKYNNKDYKDYPRYSTYVAIPMQKVPEKDISDTLEVVDKLSGFQPKRIPLEEIVRLGEEKPLTQEDIYKPSGNVDIEPRTNPPGEEVLQTITFNDLFNAEEVTNKKILEWVEEEKIPKDIYKDIAKEAEPLPKKLYIDSKKGKAILQMHVRGIEPDLYKKVISKEIDLWECFVGQSVHMDLRITYPDLKKMVQFVVTENDIQSMVRMIKGETRKTKGGQNVQHSKVVSKPSGEPPSGPEKFYKKVEAESEKPEEYSPAVNEDGAKLIEELDLGSPFEETRSFWMEPGEIGATKNTYSYMALIWVGDIISGCERHDLHELFVNQKEAKEEELFNGRFIIKCLGGKDNPRWEMWKAYANPKPMDSIQHSDIGYHYLVPASKVDGFGRDFYRDKSKKLFKDKIE